MMLGKSSAKLKIAEWVNQEAAAKAMKMKAETPMKETGETPKKGEPDLISDDNNNGTKKKKFAIKKIKIKYEDQ